MSEWSKEVVNAALELKKPRYVPLGVYCIDCDTVERIVGHKTYVRNKIATQIALWEGRRDEVVQSLKEDTVELYRKLDCIDLITWKDASILPPKDYTPEKVKRIDDVTWMDQKGRVYRYSELTNDITMVDDPNRWSYEFKKEDYEGEPPQKAPDESMFEAIDYLIKELGHDRYIAGPTGGTPVMVLLGGMERGLMEYVTNPEVVKLATQWHVKRANYNDQFYIRPGCDGVLMEQDFSYKNGPMLSPAMFREFCFPAMKERVGNVKNKYGKKVMFHACGNNWSLLDMFVESGIDAYQSIQPTAGMDIKEVKEKYGDKLCLWGGVAVEHLVSGSMEEVRQDVRNAMQWAGYNGGFILGPSHSIAYGTKYDNFMAMLDEYDKLKYTV